MNMAQKKSSAAKNDALLDIIRQSTPTAPEAEPETANDDVQTVQGIAAVQEGRKTSIYLNPEDLKILRELTVWFAGQGRRVNDTLIIRAALRAVQPGNGLLAAYEDASKSDRRYKRQ